MSEAFFEVEKLNTWFFTRMGTFKSVRDVSFALEEGKLDPMGNEPVLANGEVVGRLTSGGFGFHVGHAIGCRRRQPRRCTQGPCRRGR